MVLVEQCMTQDLCPRVCCEIAGERLVGALAPELVPILATLEMPACFVPTTNGVLAEMQRRGIGRDAILGELRRMGREIPTASISMLQACHLSLPIADADISKPSPFRLRRMGRHIPPAASIFLLQVQRPSTPP